MFLNHLCDEERLHTLKGIGVLFLNHLCDEELVDNIPRMGL